MDISGAIAFVTGGGGGLGSRICTLLANEGVDVAIGYHQGKDRAEDVRERIEAAGAAGHHHTDGCTVGTFAMMNA